MAIKKKTETKVTKNQEQEQAVDHVVSVTRAKELENVIMFDIEINGIKMISGTFSHFFSKKANAF